jgi:shikimate dehydrogenase
MAPLRYAVFGQPVAHSRSPRIHAAFAAQAGIELVYERVEAPPDGFVDALARFADRGGRGANVTLPHKAAARLVCETLGERARRAGAVNTLSRLDAGADGRARWHGDNTDGTGLVRDLQDRHAVPLAGARVLLLGAGGAAAGVAPALLDAGVDALVVLNRNPARAQALVAHLADARACVATPGQRPDGALPVPARTATAAGPPFDIVINATSAARTGAAPWDEGAACLHPATIAVDLGYGGAAAPFLGFARAHGVRRRIDGLGMLVEQAAESFRLWHGVAPDTRPVHADLRAELGVP